MRRCALALALALALAGCGTASSTRTTSPARAPALPAGRLSIVPARGTPRTVFVASFSPPVPAPAASGVRTGFQLGLSGPQGQNCAGTGSLRLNTGASGTATSASLNPSQFGGPWCPGRYAARVTEIQAPICAPGTMCPQFVRVVGVVARASFTVSPH